MLDASHLQLRNFCRNPACRRRLPHPVDDERAAFCDERCQFRYGQFHCPACGKPLRKTDRQKRKQFCSEKCRSAYRRNPERFERFFGGAATLVPQATGSAPKSPDISKAISGDFGDRLLRIIAGPDVHLANLLIPPDPKVVARTKTAKRTAIIGRRDWPIDLVGNAGGPRHARTRA